MSRLQDLKILPMEPFCVNNVLAHGFFLISASLFSGWLPIRTSDVLLFSHQQARFLVSTCALRSKKNNTENKAGRRFPLQLVSKIAKCQPSTADNKARGYESGPSLLPLSTFLCTTRISQHSHSQPTMYKLHYDAVSDILQEHPSRMAALARIGGTTNQLRSFDYYRIFDLCHLLMLGPDGLESGFSSGIPGFFSEVGVATIGESL